MNKTDIEWCDYSANPVKGLCPVGCEYCYARRMYKRFHWDETIRFDRQWYVDIDQLTKPSRIFVGSTFELFGDWMKPWWMEDIFEQVRYWKQHTFIFLTKKPENLLKFSPFPDNAWVGASATNQEQLIDALQGLHNIEATVKFISFEPLLEQMNGGECEGKRLDGLKQAGISWIIVGQCTPASSKTQPKIEWIKAIVEAADEAGVPVFLKNNLRELLVPKALLTDCFWESEKAKLRQEFPKVKVA